MPTTGTHAQMSNMQIHRSSSTSPTKAQTAGKECAIHWIKEGSKKWTCATPQCTQSYNAKKELRRHNIYY